MRISKKINDTKIVKINSDEYENLLKMARIDIANIGSAVGNNDIDEGFDLYSNPAKQRLEEQLKKLKSNNLDVTYELVEGNRYKLKNSYNNEEYFEGTLEELSNMLEEVIKNNNINEAENKIEIFYKDGKISKVVASKKQLIELGKKAGFI